jgi:hypothetical protein
VRRTLGPSVIATLGVVLMGTAMFVAVTLPPRTAQLDRSVPPTVVYGGFHIHSSLSDGTATVDVIARAAAEAGLAFIILTDHGDGTRPPLPPEYRAGVLCIDAVEITTDAGHVVALGLPGATPYALAGPPRDVIEDIHRLGGWAVIAHPDSPKTDLAWRDWNVPYDGIEWLNADAEWRNEGPWRLMGVAARFVVRPAESVASLFERPVRTLRRWDATSATRPVVGLAALDAHALSMAPGYLAMFRTVNQAAVLDAPLSRDAGADASRVLAALRAGRTFSIVRALAWPASLDFSATVDSITVPMGGIAEAGRPAIFHVQVPEAPGAQVVLLRNGTKVTSGLGRLSYSSPAATGAFRVEVLYPGRTMPWMVSNPIDFVDVSSAPMAMPPAVSTDALGLSDAGGWVIERDAASSGAVVADGAESRFAFALGPGDRAGQYVALGRDVAGEGSFDRVQFTARADQPLRLSVQLHLAGSRSADRWRRTFYVDQTPRSIVLPLEAFEPIDRSTSQRPVAVGIRRLLIVADTLNLPPGRHATVWLSALGLGRAARKP